MLRAYNARQGIARARTADPDIVFIDWTLPDARGMDLCQEFVQDQIVSSATALVLVASGPTTRDQRVEAMRRGAWEVISLPADAEELVLRVEKYVRAKLVMDRAREEALIDGVTGLYSREGLTRRIRELSAAADRFGRPLTFVVFSAGNPDDEPVPEPAILTRLADELRGATRKSDVLGRIGPAEFIVITPDTPPEGARNLAERLRKWAGESPGAPRTTARVEVHAVENVHDASLEPLELLKSVVRTIEKDGAPGLN